MSKRSVAKSRRAPKHKLAKVRAQLLADVARLVDTLLRRGHRSKSRGRRD